MELRATLKTRKLLILLNEKNDKNTGLAQLRYTPGTRPPVHSPLAAMVIVLRECLRTIAETCRSRVNAGHRDPPQFAKIIELVLWHAARIRSAGLGAVLSPSPSQLDH
jgi:hypothetical protein